ncbi:hypothetical protein [Pontibacter sp. H249]|uniref:hypothetical protein n=1 Tax=Pontibacter sp. H249 TaxID=3133420 RepID=UPI0030BB30A7
MSNEMAINEFAGYTALIIVLLLIVTVKLKVYYHFKLVQKTDNLKVSFLGFLLNPMSYIFIKTVIYFPFTISVTVADNDEEQYKYRKYVILLSWVNLIGFVVVMTIAILTD